MRHTTIGHICQIGNRHKCQIIHMGIKEKIQIEQGQRFKMLRTDLLKLTQEELAKQIGSTNRTILRYEKGEFAIPEIIFSSIAKLFPFVNVDWVKTGSGEIKLQGWDDAESFIQLTDASVKYGNPNMECEHRLKLAIAEIFSLKAQLEHAKLLLESKEIQ